MKYLLFFLFFFFYILAAFSQNALAVKVDSTKELMNVEVSCGQCKFGLSGKGCALAIRIKGQAFFVDGTSIDEHGDAHATDGFCNAIRNAQVQGEVINGRFKVTYFKLLE